MAGWLGGWVAGRLEPPPPPRPLPPTDRNPPLNEGLRRECRNYAPSTSGLDHRFPNEPAHRFRDK